MVAPPDPLGFALQPWIIQSLAYLTLTCHLLAMNFTLGSVFLYLWTRLRGGEEYRGAGDFLGSGLPLGVSYLITLGIPPLLFVQVLYGQLFYSSSVIMGAFWIQVIPVMILAYAGFYYFKLTRGKRPRERWYIVGLSGLLLLYIGFIYVNNFTLTMSPEKMLGLYTEHPGGGVLTHGEPSIVPRFLLFIGGSLAVAGLALIWRGIYLRRWGFETEADRSQGFGFRAVLISPALWAVAAAGLYLTRPDGLAAMWQSTGSTLILFIVGLLGCAVMIIFARAAAGTQSVRAPLIASLGMFLTMASMVIFRDLVRIEVLRPHFSLSSVPVNTQWGMFILFVITLVAGLTLMGILFVKVFPGMAERSREQLEGLKRPESQ